MAAWTDYATLIASLAAGKAFTDEKAQALAENPVAIAEGATGAQRLYGLAAIPDSRASAELAVITVAAADTYNLANKPNTTQVAGTLTEAAGAFVVARTITIGQLTGSARFYAASTIAGGAATGELQVKKNGVLVLNISGGTPLIITQDISIVPGDIITWEHRRTSGTSTFSSPSTTADDYYTRIGLLIRGTEL